MRFKNMNRREFLITGSGAAAVGLVGRGESSTTGEPKGKARVVLARDEKVVKNDGGIDADRIHRLLNEAVTAVVEAPDSATAWKKLVGPDDVVGIKSNVWHYLPTPKVLEDAIRHELLTAGVAPGNVAVDDRNVKANPVFQRATALINTRPMRTHNWSGLGTCIKNLITFTERYPDYHGDACAPLGSIWLRPEIQGKVRLNVLVMLTPQFHSVGPHSFSRDYVWTYGGLIAGVDPVAVDATGARIIEAKRRLFFGDGRPMSPPPHHIQIADTQYGIGVSDPGRIDIVRLGWEDDALI